MTDLEPLCGLPIAFDAKTFTLVSKREDWKLPEPGLRTSDEMRPVLLDPDADLPDPVYWMYRDICLPGHEHMRRELGLRYDISVFRANPMGREVFKTIGHYHPYIRWRYPISYPEVYEVLYGEAVYLLQKVDDIYRDPYYIKVEDFIVVHAKPGQKVIMPPNYGHVTLNPSPDLPLVMSNWVSDWFKSVYEAIIEARGFAYYCLAEGGAHQWVANRTYRQPLPSIREARTCDSPEIGLIQGKPMYPLAIQSPEKFEYLCRPQGYLAQIWQSLDLV
jgi:glucose-6-phosphate isomerase